MNSEQKKNQSKISKWFTSNHKEKYERGAREHGGNLGDVPLERVMFMLGEEILDLPSYYVNAMDKIEEMLWENRRLRAQNTYYRQELGLPDD